MDDRKVATVVWFAALAVLWLGIAQPASAAQAAQSTTAGTTTSQCVGSDTCKGCHEEIFTKGFEHTAHFQLTKEPENKYPGHGCESCHGPGSAHVEGGGDKTKIIRFTELGAKESSAICLNCHTGSEHANFLRSEHMANNIGCTSCHSPHHAKTERALLMQSQPTLCYGCHTEEKAEFSRPFRHRVNEGLIQCSDCHNVHGSFRRSQLRASYAQDAVCFKCHTDKKGPFVYEHLPVKTEGCQSCHIPHGSTNPKLLRVWNVNLLCLQCHTLSATGIPSQPPIGPVHSQNVKYQACTMCHAFIHGSNFSEVFFKQ